jgi:hypothetical protein
MSIDQWERPLETRNSRGGLGGGEHERAAVGGRRDRRRISQQVMKRSRFSAVTDVK